MWLRSFIFLLWLTPGYAANIEVIELQHRNAEDVLPLISPLLNEDEAISGIHNQLIIRAKPEQLSQLRQLIQRLDIARRNLLITVAQDGAQRGLSESRGVNGEVIISNRKSHIDLQGQMAQQRFSNVRQQQQQLRVLEGEAAFIQTGEARPTQHKQLIRDRWGEQRIIESTNYQTATTGFYVKPKLNGQQVELEIYTQDNHFQSNRQLQTQQSHSVVHGQIGQWITLAGQQRDDDHKQRYFSGQEQTQQHQWHDVNVKIELVE